MDLPSHGWDWKLGRPLYLLRPPVTLGCREDMGHECKQLLTQDASPHSLPPSSAPAVPLLDSRQEVISRPWLSALW